MVFLCVYCCYDHDLKGKKRKGLSCSSWLLLPIWAMLAVTERDWFSFGGRGAWVNLFTCQVTSVYQLIKRTEYLLLCGRDKSDWLIVIKGLEIQGQQGVKRHSALFRWCFFFINVDWGVLSQPSTQCCINFQSEHLTDASTLNLNIILSWEIKHDLPLLARFLWCRVIWSMMASVPLMSRIAQVHCLNRGC